LKYEGKNKTMITLKINGIVKEKETGFPLTEFLVKVYDKKLRDEELLGSGMTDQQGQFEIFGRFADEKELCEKKLNLFFKVYLSDGKTLIYSDHSPLKHDKRKKSYYEILISWKDIQKVKPAVVQLFGDNGEARHEFSVGESLIVHVTGLRPGTPHHFSITADGNPLFTSTLLSDRRGVIDSAVLWPQMGLDDPNSQNRFTPEEAMEKWNGKKISLTLLQGKEPIQRARFTLTNQLQIPLVIASDREGRLLNGFEIGTQPLFFTVANLPFSGPAKMYLVPRQHDWNPGDVFAPITFPDGSPAIREIIIKEGRHQQTFPFAEINELMPGAYDFVLRPIRYGFEEDNLLVILPTDILGGRRVTGIVIREPFWIAKPVLGGCVNKIPISGASLSGAPYFRYRDTFTFGEDVWAGIDPGIVDPGNISKMCALYVIQSKDNGGWMNNALNHLPVLGGNANTTKHKLQAGCMNANKILVWPNAMQEGEYDIVADFGNNTPDANLFVQDNQYNTPLDMIDGYFVAGFRVVRDPGTMQDFTNVGNWNYDQTTVTGMGLPGTVNLQDEAGHFHGSVMPTIVNRDVRMKAHVYFPADMPGITNPAQISAAKPNYPLIVIIHGNGHDYTTYDFLLQHFAGNGFIAASIDVRYFNGASDVHGMSGLGRANALFPHLTILNTAFGAKAQNNIGIMGHSRGGEAVIKAARLNQQQGLGHNLNALISLAPTDQYGSETLSGAWTKPYFVLYGSRDGDINGGIWTPGYTVPQTGFALYDRAESSQKSMCFVYKATHNGFITDNHDAPWDGDVIANMEPVATQKAFTKAYMNAFYRWHLKNEPQWNGMFAGEWTPGSVSSTGAKFFMQYHDTTIKTVDNFEGPVNWQASTIGGTVAHNATLPVDPSEGKMSAASIAGLDPKSPHDTQGLKVKWDTINDALTFTIPAAHKDISAYSILSFRVTQKVDSASNPANQSQNFRVLLKDGTNNERAVRVNPFYNIPFPDHRPNHAVSKSAMLTVRIPLKSYTIVCAGQAQVNLTDVTTLAFKFSEKATGEIEIDDIEFTN
jgi:hypothetical protein